MENGKSFRCTQLLPRRSITPTKPCYDYQIAGGTSAGPHTARASGLSSLFQGGCSIQSFVRAASSSRNPQESDVPVERFQGRATQVWRRLACSIATGVAPSLRMSIDRQ
jgi:hypothetical protein